MNKCSVDMVCFQLFREPFLFTMKYVLGTQFERLTEQAYKWLINFVISQLKEGCRQAPSPTGSHSPDRYGVVKGFRASFRSNKSILSGRTSANDSFSGKHGLRNIQSMTQSLATVAIGVGSPSGKKDQQLLLKSPSTDSFSES